MANSKGAALRGCVLAGCVLMALSATTVTQQSSSAWGSIDGGRTVERGTHTSRTADILPDGALEPELELEGRFGGGLGVRGGFGTSRRQPQPSNPTAGQDPSTQAQPFSPGVAQGPSQRLPPFSPSAGRGPSGQPLPFIPSIGQYPSQPSPSVGSSDSSGAEQGVPQQPVPEVDPPYTAFPQFMGRIPGFNNHRGFFGQQPTSVLPQSGPGPRGGFGQPWPYVGGGYDPIQQTFAAGPAQVGGAPQPSGTPGLSGAGIGQESGTGVSSLPHPGNPLHPDIGALIDQVTAEAFQNIARGFQPGLYQGIPQDGMVLSGAGGFVPPGSGGYPSQPAVQSQHASVASRSFGRTWPLPDAKRTSQGETSGGTLADQQPPVEQQVSVQSRFLQRPFQLPVRFPQPPNFGNAQFPNPVNEMPPPRPYFRPGQGPLRADHHAIWFPRQ